jgi:hypothetical protein
VLKTADGREADGGEAIGGGAVGCEADGREADGGEAIGGGAGGGKGDGRDADGDGADGGKADGGGASGTGPGRRGWRVGGCPSENGVGRAVAAEVRCARFSIDVWCCPSVTCVICVQFEKSANWLVR